MAYKFIPASLSITPKGEENPKNQYIEIFQETLNQQFYNSADWWTIQEETSLGSGSYVSTDVRINHVINAETGLKLGDDWKTLLFKEIDHSLEYGRQYIFDDNVWLTINIEKIKNLTGTCTVRRCNNTLRWIDEPTGIVYEEPCIIEYMVKEPRDYMTQGSPFMTPGGFIKIYTQFNSRTSKIRQNQRFLFGNREHWTCYKVAGTGINDFRNMSTYDNDSSSVLVLDLIANFTNDEMDDMVRGIADVYSNLYTITLSRTSLSGSPSGSMQLFANVTYNGDSVTRTLSWESSNKLVATVSGSGVVSFLTTGSCIITAKVAGNPISASSLVTVSASPTINIDILLSPDKNYVLEGMQRTYSVYLYKNNVQQADSFTFVCNPNDVPSANYIFTSTDGNHFTISNALRDVYSYLTITCTSGSNVKAFDIYLRGAWLYDIA